MTNNFTRTSISLAVLTALAGCAAVGPDYKKPTSAEIKIPSDWVSPVPHEGQVASLGKWWEQFQDPSLTALVLKSQEENPTIEAALARIKQARATEDYAEGELYPQVKAGASDTETHTKQSGKEGVRQNTRSAKLDMSWELDLFGGIKRNTESAKAKVEGKVADWHDARVSVAAETADAYLTYRQCEAQVSINQEDLTSKNTTRDLVKIRVDAGFQAEMDLNRIDAGISEAKSSLEAQKSNCTIQKHRLVALTGLSFDSVTKLLDSGSHKQPRPAEARIESVPAQALEQRPDLASAERSLASASADIGSATSAKYPKFSLSGAISTATTTAAGVTSSVFTWMISPLLSLILMDGGKNNANIEVSKARYSEMLEAYKGKVRTAVKEVETALTRIDHANVRIVESAKSVENYKKYFEAQNAKYQAGLVSLLDLEDARRTYLASNQSKIAADYELNEAWVQLYKSVGGGWQNYELH